MQSRLAMSAATIALSGLIPGSSQGAETSDSTNVNEPFLEQMEQSHAFDKGLASGSARNVCPRAGSMAIVPDKS